MAFRFTALVLIGFGCCTVSLPRVHGEEALPVAAAPEIAPEAGLSDEEYYELYRMLADTLDQVERNYVKKIDRRELFEAAIDGIVRKLDPYSGYIHEEDVDDFRTSVENRFGGIGIRVSLQNGKLQIISPLVGTPAYRAGLRANDIIEKIGDEPTKDLSLDDAVKRLKGPIGTSVRLTVRHPDERELQVVDVTREMVRVETVLGDHRQTDDRWDFFCDSDHKIGYIRISSFSRETPADLRRALAELKRKDQRGLILDLRFNPGGLLTAAIEVCDLFIPDGRIVSTEGRNTKPRQWDAVSEGTFEGFPIAVLVNRYSASASEIVAACLQDHGRAVVIGERTWGKGSVQNVIELHGGRSALKLTTASYLRPSGKNIHRFPDAKEEDVWGVMPNDGYTLKLSDDELGSLMRDRQQRELVVSRRAPDPAFAGAPPEPHATDAAQTSVVDRQMRKALNHLNEQLARSE